MLEIWDQAACRWKIFTGSLAAYRRLPHLSRAAAAAKACGGAALIAITQLPLAPPHSSAPSPSFARAAPTFSVKLSGLDPLFEPQFQTSQWSTGSSIPPMPPIVYAVPPSDPIMPFTPKSPTSVPEPSSLILLATAIAALAAIRKRV